MHCLGSKLCTWNQVRVMMLVPAQVTWGDVDVPSNEPSEGENCNSGTSATYSITGTYSHEIPLSCCFPGSTSAVVLLDTAAYVLLQ